MNADQLHHPIMDSELQQPLMETQPLGLLPFFTDEEYIDRLEKVKARMTGLELDACLISTPENIFYLTGLSHQGFFAYHMLIVPMEGQLTLITRSMEQATVELLVPSARFIGYIDSSDPIDTTVEALKEDGLQKARLGMEKETLFLSPRIAERLQERLPQAAWSDISGLVDDCRLIKSNQEIEYTRKAAKVADAMMQTAIETAGIGVSEQDIAAEVYRTMVKSGGEYPGFGPFIRATPTLPLEHATWSDHVLQKGDLLFIELAGCWRRYHAPMGRLVVIGDEPNGIREVEQVCLEAFHATTHTIRPGVKAHQVYDAWQDCLNENGFSHYVRHHCGYSVGIGFPPSWVGGNQVVGLRSDSDMELAEGMIFHLLSWMLNSGRGDYFVSNTALVTKDGCEILTTLPNELMVV